MKAICVLEAVVRKQDTDPYSIVASYFSENSASVVRCCELPQVSLREKASKVSQLTIVHIPSMKENFEISHALFSVNHYLQYVYLSLILNDQSLFCTSHCQRCNKLYRFS